MRLGRWLLKRYLRRLQKRRPHTMVLDLDSTDDPTRGQQEFSFYHGYYRSHILHPLLIFDGESGDLLVALLRPGNRGAATHSVAVLRRVVQAIQAACPQVKIRVRADCGFGTPELYEYCEQAGLRYEIGLIRNTQLQKAAEPVLQRTREQFQQEGTPQREFDAFVYQAGTWAHPRRVVVKVEVNSRGINRRFVVTNRNHPSARSLYEEYTDRGQTENFIKSFKLHLKMDRLSCHRFLANQFRLLLHGVAYQMFLMLRAGLPLRDPLEETGSGDAASSDAQDRSSDSGNDPPHLDPLELGLSRTRDLLAGDGAITSNVVAISRHNNPVLELSKEGVSPENSLLDVHLPLWSRAEG